MAKCTPTVDIREVTVIETIETQTGVTLELSNIEAHVLTRLVGNIGGQYDTSDPTLLRAITSGLWNKLVDAGYGTQEHLRDGATWFESMHSHLVAKEGVRPADIEPGVSK